MFELSRKQIFGLLVGAVLLAAFAFAAIFIVCWYYDLKGAVKIIQEQEVSANYQL